MTRQPNAYEICGDYTKIFLTQGQVTLIDTADLEKVLKYRWFAEWRANIHDYNATTGAKAAKPARRLHRFLLKDQLGPNDQIDHIDHNGLNNRRYNLRIVSNRENQQNRKRIARGNYPGVRWNPRSCTWIASVVLNKRKIYLGSHPSQEVAFLNYAHFLLTHQLPLVSEWQIRYAQLLPKWPNLHFYVPSFERNQVKELEEAEQLRLFNQQTSAILDGTYY